MSIRIGILGCAHIAKSAIVTAVREVPELSLVAVASREHGKALAYAREHGIPNAHPGYAALLADPEIDAVYIPLPNSLHAEWTLAALKAGKAVLCEKPLAANAIEAARMAQGARDSNRLLMEAFHYRYHPMMRFISGVLEAGRLGRIRSLYAGLEIPAGLAGADNIRFQSDLAGGAMMDVGAYCMNAMRFVAKEEPLIERAAANLLSPGIDGAMKASVRFPSGMTGEMQCSLIASRFHARLKITGDAGWIEAHNPFLPQLGNKLVMAVGDAVSHHDFDLTPTYVFQARAFAAAVRGEAASLSSADDGVANMKAIDSIYEAAGLAPRGGAGPGRG